MRLKGKTAMITAAGAGIGRATAVAFAEQGARVIATDINTNSFVELQKLGIETSQLDVLDSSTLNSFAEDMLALIFCLTVPAMFITGLY